MIKEKYQKEVRDEMKKKFSYSNVNAIPKIEKIIINTGFGKFIIQKTKDEQKKFYKYITENLKEATGQTPVLTEAKKSIASFKLRQGNIIGAKVTLRNQRMYDFLERLIDIVIPRTRDFRGVPLSAVDKNGNLNFGIKEHIVFPEISPEKARHIFGIQITIKTTAKTKEECVELLRLLDFPLRKS